MLHYINVKLELYFYEQYNGTCEMRKIHDKNIYHLFCVIRTAILLLYYSNTHDPDVFDKGEFSKHTF